MTDLQLALSGLGILIIVAIVLFNWWQERRLRTDISERFSEPSEDALMDDTLNDTASILGDDATPSLNEDELDQIATEPEVYITPEAYIPEDEPVVADPMHREESASDSINEVSLALQEFERDMSEPYQEPPQANNPEDAQEEDVPAEIEDNAVAMGELAEEAGLDKDVVMEAKSVSPDNSHTKLPVSTNQQIDLIALLYLPEPVSGSTLREFLSSLTDIDKPVYAHGLDASEVWHLLTKEQESDRFARAAYSLQLADRSGFVSKTSLSHFQDVVDSIANKLGAQVEWQGKGDPWQFASELDQFCADVDKMIGFHLVRGDSGPFTGTKFRGLAEASGLTLKENGEFHYEAESESESGNTQTLFAVVNQENNPFNTEMLRTSVVHGVSFQLDIPRVKNCTEVFNQMVLAARQMEKSLGANLVDDNGRPLSDLQIEKIREQLKVIHAKMVARGVVPGSDSALRLFS